MSDHLEDRRKGSETRTHAFSISTRIAASSTGGRPRTVMMLFLDSASMVGRTLVRVWDLERKGKKVRSDSTSQN